jgi:hypothetical protein
VAACTSAGRGGVSRGAVVGQAMGLSAHAPLLGVRKHHEVDGRQVDALAQHAAVGHDGHAAVRWLGGQRRARRAPHRVEHLRPRRRVHPPAHAAEGHAVRGERAARHPLQFGRPRVVAAKAKGRAHAVPPVAVEHRRAQLRQLARRDAAAARVAESHQAGGGRRREPILLDELRQVEEDQLERRDDPAGHRVRVRQPVHHAPKQLDVVHRANRHQLALLVALCAEEPWGCRQEEAARGAQEAVGERLRVALGASAGAAVRLVANLHTAGEARERGARVKGGSE